MTLFKNFKWSFKSAFKALGLILAVMILIGIAIPLFQFLGNSVGRLTNQNFISGKGGYAVESASFASPMASRDYAEESFALGDDGGNIILPPDNNFTPGDDAESYEEKSYYVSTGVRNPEKTCAQIAQLKAREEVIFENANEGEYGCNYRFKVDKAHEAEILSIIEALDPDDLNENIRTIKRQVEDTESQLDILQKKLEAVEATLEEAQSSYDVIAEFATNQQNAEALAKIVDDKLKAIERLSNERLNLKNQIDWQNKMREEQIDRLTYTFFDVNIYKDVMFDWKQIKEDWRMAVREMFSNISSVLKLLSVQLVGFVLYLAIGIAYLFGMVFVVKYVWKGVKKIWKHGEKVKRK